ncbi:hypothetical protein ACFL27_27535 [candidate division CSSED10-310 bacterium]|uniref:MBL fold metallo-hydrolase n=1 Tax=candidate division CSSED10-310 bacterium TaxID=2855610 RepID=A0ABV6Z682_UNCC1
MVISHLHVDHMGGMKASRSNQIIAPSELGLPQGVSCYVPEEASAVSFNCRIVDKPIILAAGIATTGPLGRSLFFLGLCEEQALIANIKDKGLVILTGCGHPTLEVIMKMVKKISDRPVYAIGGGLHFPVTGGSYNVAGLRLQSFIGTGKPPWERITDQDLDKTIAVLNYFKPHKVYLSAHDTCDYALTRLQQELTAEVEVFKAGATYRF